MKTKLCLFASALLLSVAFAVPASANLITNGDFSASNPGGTGMTIPGWTPWDNPGWGANKQWDLDIVVGSPAPSAKASFYNSGASSSGSIGWYQVIDVPVGQEVQLTSVDWTGKLSTQGWAEVMFFTMPGTPTHNQIYTVIDAGAPANTYAKKDSWGLNLPNSGTREWAWESASLSTKAGFNNGVITSAGKVIVALKSGTGGTSGGTFTNWDNITVVPEPSSFVLLGMAAMGLFLLRRRS